MDMSPVPYINFLTVIDHGDVRPLIGIALPKEDELKYHVGLKVCWLFR